MDNAQLKREMLGFFKSVREELDKVAAELTEDQKKERGSLDKWSVSDIFTHLAFWQEHFNKQLEAAQKGENVPNAGDYYLLLNDGIFIRNSDNSFEEMSRKETESFKKSIELFEAIDADDLNDPEKYEYLQKRPILDRALGTYGWHTVDHISNFYVSNGQLDKAVKLQESYTEKMKRFPS